MVTETSNKGGAMDTTNKPQRETWVPACGGTETAFKTRTGRTLIYMWCPSTGEHAYYDIGADVFLTNEEAALALAIF